MGNSTTQGQFQKPLEHYLIVNALLWGLWYFGSVFTRQEIFRAGMDSVGWVIGLTFHFAGAYVFPKETLLKRNRKS